MCIRDSSLCMYISSLCIFFTLYIFVYYKCNEPWFFFFLCANRGKINTKSFVEIVSLFFFFYCFALVNNMQALYKKLKKRKINRNMKNRGKNSTIRHYHYASINCYCGIITPYCLFYIYTALVHTSSYHISQALALNKYLNRCFILHRGVVFLSIFVMLRVLGL